MQQELVGYLLKALGRDETIRVEHVLSSCSDTRRQLEILLRGLEPLVAAQGEVEIPSGLSLRTCQRIREIDCGSHSSSERPSS